MDYHTAKNRGGGVLRCHNLYDTIISKQNLFSAWREFKRGKSEKMDVLQFALDAEEHILNLHAALRTGEYRHGPYEDFYVFDPKKRHIHKAQVVDRVLHHAIFRILYPAFDRQFICDSFASRLGKGTHAALTRFERFAWTLSTNNTRSVWVLQCDIEKFFDTMSHTVLLGELCLAIQCSRTRRLLAEVIQSFEREPGRGLPLGNLTSQLFANVYLNHLDQYIKRELRFQHYLRYADDFALLSINPSELIEMLSKIKRFLALKLRLNLHRRKVRLERWHRGVDFLGYVSFPHFRILRTKTKRRLLRRITQKNLASYRGLLKHCRGRSIENTILGMLGKADVSKGKEFEPHRKSPGLPEE